MTQIHLGQGAVDMLPGQGLGRQYAQCEGTTPSGPKIGGARGQLHRTPRSLPSHDSTEATKPVRRHSSVLCGTRKSNEI